MIVRPRSILLVIGGFAVAVLGWLLAGWIVRLAGLGELDLPARSVGVFVALGLGEAALARLFGPA